MVKTRKYVVVKHFRNEPKRDDFEILEEELPALKQGEILLKAEYFSLDPYFRSYNSRHPVPYDQFGYQVGVVEESKDPNYPVGCRVVTHNGWCTYSIKDTSTYGEDLFDIFYKLPDLRGLSPSIGVGAIGLPGASAYFGFLEICKPKPGETVVVTGAAGAVGSIVGQIAKIKGCRVIGFAGSEDKVSWLESIGFDKAYNYKTVDITEAVREAAPNGVDCYFDNVGGEISSAIIYEMNRFGRVSVCGSISAYNSADACGEVTAFNVKNLPKASILQVALMYKQLKIEGFVADRWAQRWPEAFEVIIGWIKSGQLKVHEHVTEGFENVVEAFSGMLTGDNTGKAVVKI